MQEHSCSLLCIVLAGEWTNCSLATFSFVVPPVAIKETAAPFYGTQCFVMPSYVTQIPFISA